jgi:hypothetical protein
MEDVHDLVVSKRLTTLVRIPANPKFVQTHSERVAKRVIPPVVNNQTTPSYESVLLFRFPTREQFPDFASYFEGGWGNFHRRSDG